MGSLEGVVEILKRHPVWVVAALGVGLIAGYIIYTRSKNSGSGQVAAGSLGPFSTTTLPYSSIAGGSPAIATPAPTTGGSVIPSTITSYGPGDTSTPAVVGYSQPAAYVTDPNGNQVPVGAGGFGNYSATSVYSPTSTTTSVYSPVTNSSYSVQSSFSSQTSSSISSILNTISTYSPSTVQNIANSYNTQQTNPLGPVGSSGFSGNAGSKAVSSKVLPSVVPAQTPKVLGGIGVYNGTQGVSGPLGSYAAPIQGTGYRPLLATAQ